MNLKTIITLFLLGILISCSSNKDTEKKEKDRHYLFPDHIRN